MERPSSLTAEGKRLAADATRAANWKRWGPYLAERQWATVREDYSADGDSWNHFPHDHARSRAYRWGEDGLLGISDRECRLCFAIALWNGRDPILKERLFGLTNSEGNHGEDVKELYYYLRSTPTHSYMKALYKYPQAEFPYSRLVADNRQRGLNAPECELLDTGIFNDNRYFDVTVEYAKADANDILIRLTIANRGSEKATLHLLPTLWFRNTWSWGAVPDEITTKPSMRLQQGGLAHVQHDGLGEFIFAYEGEATPLFTDNETNNVRLFGQKNGTAFVKDAFHERVIHGKTDATNSANVGTKFAPHYVIELHAGEERIVRLRLSTTDEVLNEPFAEFDNIFYQRILEEEEFFAAITPPGVDEAAKNVARQGYAGLLWSKQFYNYIVREWLTGDPAQPLPPPERLRGRNHDWQHLFSRDVISMPDKWEYPWFAAWDLAFHMVPFAKLDPDFAKRQVELFLREWYMHPNGQIPAYEFAFGDVNPPVHAWAAWRVYKMAGSRGERDTRFLESTFQKLLLNFTWWVNRKDAEGNNLFSGGFLGLDNIGVFDRSRPLPKGGYLEQADASAWMAFYCLTMLSIALELAETNPVYEDMASKFFEHFIAIADAMNTIGGTGLWNDEDGFYYDKLKIPGGQELYLRTRSVVGLLPLIAVEVIENSRIEKLRGFKKRMDWFLNYRKDLHETITYCELCPSSFHRMLAVPTKERLTRALRYALDEKEFLSPYGLRSLSKYHCENPYILEVDEQEHRVTYVPGEADSRLFGGNSNWRGPVWFPINYLIIEALERYHHFYGDTFKVECPTGSGNMMNLAQVAQELSRRLTSIFLPNDAGARPCHGDVQKYATDPYFKDLVLFYEYFHGETGRGCGASHQTGWSALAIKLLENAFATG